jgi:phage head maturation protease
MPDDITPEQVTEQQQHDAPEQHDEQPVERADAAPLAPASLTMYAPITRVDKDEWVIEGQATSEAVDSYGTIFEYESSKKAFQRWMQRGNIREQHDPKKAVGKALAVEFDDANRAIFVRARISKGARDTWEKILDGTLSGFSIGVPSATAKTRYIDRAGKSVPCYYDHELAELSVVDAPGSPLCDIAIARADGFITDVVEDIVEETQETPITSPEPDEQVERAGKTISAATSDKLHTSIAHTLHAAVSQMQTCNCDNCMKAQKLLDPDGDGDIDIGSFDDPDQDADSLYNGRDGDMDRALAASIERILNEKLTPVYQRLQSIAGTLARSNAQPLTIDTVDSSITRALQTLEARLASLPTQTSLDEVRSSLEEVRGQVVRIAETPVPGAPVQYASATQRPQPVEKRLPTDPYQAPQRSGSSVYDAIAQLSAQGMLDTPDKQAEALTAGLLAQRQGR